MSTVTPTGQEHTYGLLSGLPRPASRGWTASGAWPRGRGHDASVAARSDEAALGTYLVIVPAIVVVVMLAANVPARRAADIDPLAALRQE